MMAVYLAFRLAKSCIAPLWEFAQTRVGMVIIAALVGFSYGQYRCAKSMHEQELARTVALQRKQLEASRQALVDEQQLSAALKRLRDGDREKINEYAKELEKAHDQCALSEHDTEQLRHIGDGQPPPAPRINR